VDQPRVVIRHGLALSNVTKLKRNTAIVTHRTVLNRDACAYTFLTLSSNTQAFICAWFYNCTLLHLWLFNGSNLYCTIFALPNYETKITNICIITNTMYCLSLVCWIITPLHVLGISTAHHQEVECIYVANGTCYTAELTVSGPMAVNSEVLGDQKVPVHLMIQYRKLQVMFKVSPTSLQTFIDTPSWVLEDRVQCSTVHIPTVFCDGHLQIISNTMVSTCMHVMLVVMLFVT
jgi:hypothetical protein